MWYFQGKHILCLRVLYYNNEVLGHSARSMVNIHVKATCAQAESNYITAFLNQILIITPFFSDNCLYKLGDVFFNESFRCITYLFFIPQFFYSVFFSVHSVMLHVSGVFIFRKFIVVSLFNNYLCISMFFGSRTISIDNYTIFQSSELNG